MRDKEKKVRSNEQLRIQADTWNNVIDMLRWWNRHKDLSGSEKPYTSTIHPYNTIFVSNSTGDDLFEPYQVVRLDGFLTPVDADNKHDFARTPRMGGYVPDSDTDNVAILQRPAEIDTVVPGVVSGVSLCRVLMNDTGHTFAVPVAGETAYLESAEAGNISILDFVTESGVTDSGDENIYLALVLMGGGSGSGGGCNLVNVADTECLVATVSFNSQSVDLESTGVTEWTSVQNVRYPCGTGPLVLFYDPSIGIFKAELDGRLLLWCGGSTWKGGRVTGHIGISPGSGEGEGSLESGELSGLSGCSGETLGCESGFSVIIRCASSCSVLLCCGLRIPRVMDFAYQLNYQCEVSDPILVAQSGVLSFRFVEPGDWPSWVAGTLTLDTAYVWASDPTPPVTGIECEGFPSQDCISWRLYWVIECTTSNGNHLIKRYWTDVDGENETFNSNDSGTCADPCITQPVFEEGNLSIIFCDSPPSWAIEWVITE